MVGNVGRTQLFCAVVSLSVCLGSNAMQDGGATERPYIDPFFVKLLATWKITSWLEDLPSPVHMHEGSGNQYGSCSEYVYTDAGYYELLLGHFPLKIAGKQHFPTPYDAWHADIRKTLEECTASLAAKDKSSNLQP